MDIAHVPPVAGIPITHELTGTLQLVQRDAVAWAGTAGTELPLVIRHEVGGARPDRMQAMLSVPPWCTFHIDDAGEPAAHFHAVLGEVDRHLTTIVPGSIYRVRYAAAPREPVVALQSELTAYSFALAARGMGLIAHACAFISASGDGVLCPGVSGTGKTTLAQLLGRAHAPVELLTDDRAIVTLTPDGVRVWGSPWPGAARIAGTASAPLTTIMFIRHGASRARRVVAPSEAFRRILNTLSMPLWEPARCGRALEIVDAIISNARLIELTYPPTEAAAEWLASEVERDVGVEVG